MKRAAGTIALVALCALPAAHGDSIELTTNILHAMTPIGSTPSKTDIQNIFPQNTVTKLTEIALDNELDFGVRLRAVRALPDFCLPSCAGSAAHASLVAVLGSTVPSTIPNAQGKTLLLERAAIEALGLAKSPGDVSLLATFLNSPSRDIRASTAFALRDLCQPAAVQPLRERYANEKVMQVRLAISAALRDLNTCSN
jgi:HEAT repeat protein